MTALYWEQTTQKQLIHILNVGDHSPTNIVYTRCFLFKIKYAKTLQILAHKTECKIRYFLSNITFRNFKHINPSTNRYCTFIHLNLYWVQQIGTRAINMGLESLTLHVSCKTWYKKMNMFKHFPFVKLNIVFIV